MFANGRSVFYAKYSSTDSAMSSNRSGRNAKGPNPKTSKPANRTTKGLHVMSFIRKNTAKSMSPTVNSDLVFKENADVVNYENHQQHYINCGKNGSSHIIEV